VITEEVEARLDQFEDDLAGKLDGYADFKTYLEHQAEWLKGETDRYSRKKKAVDNTIDWLKRQVLFALKTAGEKKIQTDRHSFSHVERNDYLLIHEDAIGKKEAERLIAQGFAKMELKVDTQQIQKHLKNKCYDKDTKEWNGLPDFAEVNFTEYPLIR